MGKGRAAVLAPGTVQVVFRWVSSIFRAAVDDGLLRTSPCRGVSLPKNERDRLQPPTLDQMEALLAAVSDRYRALIVFAAGTGVRQGEAFGLTTDRVDFLRRRVTIDRQLVVLPRQAPTLAPPKTDASRRVVPLPEVGKAVQARLGHASATETLDTYGHLWPDSDEQTRSAVDGVLGAWRGTVRGTEAAT